MPSNTVLESDMAIYESGLHQAAGKIIGPAEGMHDAGRQHSRTHEVGLPAENQWEHGLAIV